MPESRRFLSVLLTLTAAVLLTAACQRSAVEGEYVARVGSEALSQEEISALLTSLSLAQDSVEARHQIIEQWVTNELLAQEAVRRGLRDDPEVQRLLRENERSVLISRLLTLMTDEEEVLPTQAEITAYYERHREQMRLREPFVRVYYLNIAHQDSAAEAARVLQQLARTPAQLDDAWDSLVRRFAVEPDVSLEFADNYFPEGRAFATLLPVQNALGQLGPGQVSPVIPAGDSFHVVLVRERQPEGTLPELGWVEDEIVRRLEIQARKQMYARQVQRLRNEALARETLVLH
jgi:hypothetical protein